MILAIVLFLIGLTLSAFFSGSETGLYRVSRTRLVLDALSGSRMARGIIWLLNRPELFVATALVGNNIANYLTSLGIVMAAGILFGSGNAAELAGTVLMTPVIFVLGELLPKYWFFRAPNYLVTQTRPFFLAATLLLSPVSLLLGILGRVLQKLTGQTPFQLRLAMARNELDQLLRDGHEAGILGSSQRAVAQQLFEIGNQTAVSFGVPVQRLATVSEPIDIDQARHQSRRKNHPIVLVQNSRGIMGAVWYADLSTRRPVVKIKPVVRARVTDRHLRVLLRLYDAGSDVAVLLDEKDKVQCVVTRRQLLQPLVK